MADLVEEGEPEIVQPVVPQREADHRPIFGAQHRGSVEMGLVEVRLDDHRDAFFLQRLAGQLRPLGESAQSGQPAQEISVQRGAVVSGQVLFIRRQHQHPMLPGLQRVRVDLGFLAAALAAMSQFPPHARAAPEQVLQQPRTVLAVAFPVVGIFGEIAATVHLLDRIVLGIVRAIRAGRRRGGFGFGSGPAEQGVGGDAPFVTQAADHLGGQSALAGHDFGGPARAAHQTGEVFLLVAHLLHAETDGFQRGGWGDGLGFLFILLAQGNQDLQFVLLGFR